MTECEFMAILSAELNKLKIADAADILSEYKQHFAFKLADGLSEEEIAQKLGDPLALAAQFGAGAESVQSEKGWSKLKAPVGFKIFAALSLVVLAAVCIVFCAAALAFLSISICLFGQLNIAGLLPPMPFYSAVLFAAASLALSALSGTALVYCFALMRGLLRYLTSSSKASDEPAPFSKTQLKLRAVMRSLLIIFAAFLFLGIFVSILGSGEPEFWHAWGWFGYGG
ncbi:MAG TPA: DUF1700 domain-containing protein [Clostridia bacterium]|nr:DUF1700 domain-containing protein [Clostridia bacterium]